MNFDDGDEGFNDPFGGNRYANADGDYRGGYRGHLPPRPPMGMGYERGPPLMFGGPAGMIPGPGGPPMFGRPFPPMVPPTPRPLDNSSIKYLMRCGVPRENLKGLPRDLLNMYMAEHCHLCGHSFDTFSISRLHYLSKNHLKAQKKWLSQARNDDQRESSLKARELYCELCDVQITSKAHADSHYAGKSHKAIVIGRKVPKNPLLNQPGMEDRLHQLIRREKKFLEDVPEEEKDAKPKDVKPVASELHCEVCQTSVTCWDQMVIHINGKRHQSKEKQYILNQLRFGITDGGNYDKIKGEIKDKIKFKIKSEPGEDDNGDDKDDDDGDHNENGDGEQEQAASEDNGAEEGYNGTWY